MNPIDDQVAIKPDTRLFLDGDWKKYIEHLPVPQEKKLNEIINAHMTKLGENITVTELYQDARISQAMWYKIMNPKVTIRPEQDVLLRLAFVLHMTPKETQEFLKVGRRESLTISRERDRQIIIGLHEGFSIDKMEETLLALDLDGLLPEDK